MQAQIQRGAAADESAAAPVSAGRKFHGGNLYGQRKTRRHREVPAGDQQGLAVLRHLVHTGLHKEGS